MCFVAATVFALQACASAERLRLTPTTFRALPGWADDRQAQTVPAFRRSCARIARLPAGRGLGPAGALLRAGDWRPPCTALASVSDGDDAAARRYFERWFQPYLATDDGPESRPGKFTGYFEIELNGAREANARYATPVYGPPPGKTNAAARATRAVIDDPAGSWRARSGAPILFWAEDPVDVFFLHIQGAGRVRLDKGGILRVGYAGNNGHKFVAIGRLMLERGMLPPGGASMQSIRAWLRAHPGRAKTLMAENPRYIFFREIVGPGPIGAEGIALSAGRSLAVDPAFVSFGTPIWLDSFWPGRRDQPLRRLMVAQDTGAAIKGPVRGDVFWGAGPSAAALAGRMNAPGHYYLLLPRGAYGS